MALDFPASASALWGIYDATGVRPEWLLPMLWLESNFSPSVQNHQGAPYYGIGQNGAGDIQAAGTDVQTYLTWPASEQLAKVVGPYIARAVKANGPLRSATRLEQANFLPATLKTATGLNDVISSQGDAYYSYNAGLDANHDGQITVGDLATRMKAVVALPEVQQAISQTYSARMWELPFKTDAVYGEDFGFFRSLTVGKTVTLVAAAGGAAWLYESMRYEGTLDRAKDILFDTRARIRHVLGLS